MGKSARRIGLRLLAGFSAFAALSAGARAEMWRFCLAADYQGATVYFSPLFRSDQPPAELEAEFARALERRRLRERAAQCPLGGDRAETAAAMKRAEKFDREMGERVVELDRF